MQRRVATNDAFRTLILEWNKKLGFVCYSKLPNKRSTNYKSNIFDRSFCFDKKFRCGTKF